LLEIGRFDIDVLPEITELSIVKENQAKQVNIQGKRLIRVALYHYLHKKNKRLLPKITTVLQEMKARGRIEDIRAKYLLQQSFNPSSVVNSAVITFLGPLKLELGTAAAPHKFSIFTKNVLSNSLINTLPILIPAPNAV